VLSRVLSCRFISISSSRSRLALFSFKFCSVLFIIFACLLLCVASTQTGIFGSADALLGMLYEENACVPVTPRTFALSLGELTLAQRNNLACEFQRLRKHASSRCQLEVVSIRFVPLLSLGCFLSEKAGAGIQVIGDEAGGQFWLRTEFANSCRAELANPESELSKLCSGMGSLTHLRKIPLSVSPHSLPHGAPLRAFQPNTTICPFFVQGWCKFGPACPKWHPTL